VTTYFESDLTKFGDLGIGFYCQFRGDCGSVIGGRGPSFEPEVTTFLGLI
jgi:hypothetical protein